MEEQEVPISLTTALAKNITPEDLLADSPQVKKKLKDLESVRALNFLALASSLATHTGTNVQEVEELGTRLRKVTNYAVKMKDIGESMCFNYIFILITQINRIIT